MKILYVSFLHPAVAPGGAQQIAYEMFEAATEAKFEASFLAAIDPNNPLKLSKPGAVITGFEGRPHEYLFFPQNYKHDTFQINDERTLHFLSEFLQDIAPSVVHIHHYLFASTDLIVLCKKVLPSAKIVLHLHEMLAICMKDGQMLTSDRRLCYASSPVACHKCFPESDPDFFFIRKEMIQSAFRLVDHFVAPTNFLMNRYIDWGIDKNRITAIPNGTKRDAGFRPQGRSEQVNRFGFFGQIVDNKGLDVIFHAALSLIKDPSVRRPIVIDINGSNLRFASPRLKSIYEEYRVRRDELATAGVEINFLGEYDRAGLAARMARVDWVLVPSVWWETWALVVSEAWLFGKVPIVSNLGALSERVEHLKNGLHFDVGSSVALAQTIKSCAYNAALHEKLGSAAPQIIDNFKMLELHQPIYNF
ncbi:glycosyltransferase [Methylobacterium sp. J-026]|uniref:glycosyltransferase n=1 Tax=Methylobacterium sp. J-026 TaxID=2836624 RepID=UPI001FBC0D34|nr:glycosyltransferase [Methylobacterium sp. J-026]MCJ2133987.1 glycosyltransferase [Methylobacterium sp. J-026]